jgi:nucleotide-binding universal stress UspA family protein
VTLVKLGPEGTRGEGDLVVLAGEGPHAPVAARRAGEFVESAPRETSLTLLNVQQSDDDHDDDLQAQGEAIIDALAEQGGIADVDYDERVLVADDVVGTILDVADEYDSICVGATRSGALTQALFGSIPERVGERTSGTVVMARGPEESPLSIREAIVERLRVH